MNILFYHRNRFIREDLREFLDELNGRPHFAETIESAIAVLNSCAIDVAFVEIREFTDIGLLNYINQYHRNLRTVLVMENEFEKVILAVKNGKYGILRQPFRLAEIESILQK